jgi:hypothetical protein
MSFESTAEPTADPQFGAEWSWKGGAIAGFVATAAMGLVITAMNVPTLREAIAGLYALEGSLAAGWAAHLVHGTIFGLLFAAFLTDPAVYAVTERVWKTVFAGIVYGLVLAVAAAGVIMPMWLATVGFPAPPRIPFVTGPVLLWHLVYGVVLGALFPFVDHL